MNPLNRLIALVAVAMLCVVTVSQGAELVGYTFDKKASFEGVRVGMELSQPSDDDFWDQGTGADVQFRYWFGNIGFAFAVGVQQWDVEDGTSIAYVDDYTYEESINAFETESVTLENVRFNGTMEGDAIVVPAGGSALFRPTLNETVNLVVEAGLRVVFTDSDIKGSVTGQGGYVRPAGEGTAFYEVTVGDEKGVELDTGVLALVGADLEVAVADDIKLFVGGGYKFDIHAMEATWGDGGEEVGEAGFEGAYGRAGVHFSY